MKFTTRTIPSVARMLLLAAAATAGFAGGANAGGVCAQPAEQAALNTRVLQSELMVAALSCNARGQYNRFVKKFEVELVANGRTMRRYFHRAYGRRGEAEVTRFVTRLANDASARSLNASNNAYCAKARAIFDKVLALDPNELPDFVADRSRVAQHGILPCTQQAASEAGQ